MRSPSGPEVTDTGALAKIFETEPEQLGQGFDLMAALRTRSGVSSVARSLAGPRRPLTRCATDRLRAGSGCATFG